MSLPTHMGETNVDRAIDRWSFVGILVGCVAYGFHIVLAVACVRAIRRSTAFAAYPRRAHAAIAYVAVLFTIATLNIGVKATEWVTIYIDDRSSPLGPAQSLITNHGWTNTVSNICSILSLGWISDLVLIWRAWVLWNKSVPWILLPLTLVYLANAALSIAAIYGLGWAHQDTFPTLAVTLAYEWMWLGTNIVLTTLIVVRLLWMSRQAKQFAGAESSKQYVSIAAMIVESGLPLTAMQTLYNGVETVNAASATAIYPLTMQLVAISPELILWRVAKSRSSPQDDNSEGQPPVLVPLKALWSKHGGSKMAAMAFKNSARTDQSSDTGLETLNSPVIIDDTQQRTEGREGLRRTRSGFVSVGLDRDYAHDAHSRGGHLDRGDTSENARQMV